MDTIKLGDKGEQVRTLQILLNYKTSYVLTVDGEFGPVTRSALLEYQGASGLEADGICGPRTWARILKGE